MGLVVIGYNRIWFKGVSVFSVGDCSCKFMPTRCFPMPLWRKF